MKLLSTYLRGKSLTVCFAFPEDYDMANIEALNVSIGSKQFTGDDIDISGQVACVRLKSEDTYKLTGDYPIIISIDDKTRGVIPIPVGDIRFVTHRNTLNNASTNEENDIVIALSITQTTIDVDSVLYDVMKGDKGDQGEKGEKGDKGDAGDMFSGQFNTVILKQNCVWVDGWLWIDTGSKVASKIIEVGYMAISTGIATEYLKPLVHYPAAIINTNTSNPTGFYIKDIDGRLSENTDFEFVDIKYNIKNDTVAKYDGLTTLKKGGFVLEETAGEEYHSKYGIFSFDAVYPEYTGVKIESISDPLTMGEINQPYTPTYCRKRNVNLISKPYQNASVSENFGSNPDILTVSSHYGNTFERRDITANATTFLQNVIAIGSCGDGEPNPETWTSYGFGLEFSERGNNLGLNADYPTETFPHVVGYGTGSGNTFTDSTGTRNYENMLQVEIGAKVKIGLTYETAVEYTLAGLSGNTFTTVETLDLESGTNYVYIDALIGTAWQTAADNQKYYQSPVCSIVAAKFRKIQDVTGASWDTIRLACRATASNGGTWDMYRGFGVIDVDAAIQYIKDNYTENEDYLNRLADEVERTRGIDPILPYEKQTDDTPIAKRDFEPVRDKLAGIEDNANKYVHPATHPPAIIEQDANNRFVTDMEKSAWDGKQNALGFTPENDANKQNSLAVDGTGEKYPTVDAVNEGLAGKMDFRKMALLRGSGYLTYNSTTGFYEMNGLTDITEEQMMQIYNYTSQSVLLFGDEQFVAAPIRTTYRRPYNGAVSAGSFRFTFSNSIIEVYYCPMRILVANNMFEYCSKLNTVKTLTLGSTNAANYANMFKNCTALVDCEIRWINTNLSFEWSPLLSLASLQYLITNRDNGTKAITITVHPTVFAKLTDNTNYPTWYAVNQDALTKYITFASA